MMNKKTIISIFTITLIAAGVYYALKEYGSNKSASYYGYYKDVRGLQEASGIYLKGVRVGTVEDIHLNNREQVKVVFKINRDLELLAGTKAIITTGDMTGTKSVRLIPGKGIKLPPESTLHTGFDSSINESFHAKISPMISSGKLMLYSADSALYNFNKLINGSLGVEARRELNNLNLMFKKASQISDAGNELAGTLEGTVNSLDSIVSNPAKRNNSINQSLQKLDRSTEKIANKNLGRQIDSIGVSIQKLSSSFRNAKENRLLRDKETYEKAKKETDTLHKSLKDYQKNPPPLIKIGF